MLTAHNIFSEIFFYEHPIKLRNFAIRFSKSFPRLRAGLLYNELDRGAEILINVVKGVFILDNLSFSNFSRATFKIISTSYKTMDMWASVDFKLSDKAFGFFFDSVANSKNRMEFGYEIQHSANFAHFAIHNVNPMLKTLPFSSDMDLIASYDNDELISFRLSYNSFSLMLHETKIFVSILKFLH